MSSIVAVAGGAGSLGRTIVEAILADGKFDVVILSRNASAEKEKEIGARIIPVDYANTDALAEILQENNVHTLISCVNSLGDPRPELDLMKAMDKSVTTKRYVPSIWGATYTEEMGSSPIVKSKLDILAAVSGTSLEYTAWYTGYFADYWLEPHMKTYMMRLPLFVDVANNVAGISGSGNVPVAITYTFDVAKFVAASLSLPKWEPETYVIGQKLTMNELVALAEEVKGTKFKKTYDSLETLKAGKITELPSHPELYSFFPKEQLQGLLATFGIGFEGGFFDFKPSRTIMDDFPDIKPRSMVELMTEAWKGK